MTSPKNSVPDNSTKKSRGDKAVKNQKKDILGSRGCLYTKYKNWRKKVRLARMVTVVAVEEDTDADPSEGIIILLLIIFTHQRRF